LNLEEPLNQILLEEITQIDLDRVVDLIMSKLHIIPGSCWRYPSPLTDDGYGYQYYKGKYYSCHKVIYERFKGSVPKGLELDHAVCQVRNCCNPEHLEPVTKQVNLSRRVFTSDSATQCLQH
jgi:hypothetical protein